MCIRDRLYTTCPGLGLAKPYKSRLFSLLTVHSRPPFPFTFCFLSPVNSGGTAGAVFCPVGFRDEHAAADRTAFQVPIPENLRFQRSVQRQDRPAELLTADRERNRLRAGAGVPIVKDNAVAVLTATALPALSLIHILAPCRALLTSTSSKIVSSLPMQRDGATLASPRAAILSR